MVEENIRRDQEDLAREQSGGISHEELHESDLDSLSDEERALAGLPPKKPHTPKKKPLASGGKSR